MLSEVEKLKPFLKISYIFFPINTQLQLLCILRLTDSVSFQTNESAVPAVIVWYISQTQASVQTTIQCYTVPITIPLLQTHTKKELLFTAFTTRMMCLFFSRLTLFSSTNTRQPDWETAF